MEDKTKLLYDKLSEQGLYTKSFDEFTTQFSDPSKRELLHSALGKQGLYTKTLDEFNAQFFPVEKKKDLTTKDAFTSASGKEELPFLGQSGKNLVNPQESSTQPSQSISTENTPSVAPSITPSNTPSEEPKTAKTVGEWVLGTVKAFDKSLAGVADAIDYVQTSANDALNQIIFGKETAVGIKKMRDEGTLAPVLNPIRPFEAISDAINYSHSGAKPLPTGKGVKGVAGDILGGTAGVVPDILASIYAPEVKLPAMFNKLGLQVGSKFGMVMGTKSAIEGAKQAEGGTVFQKVEAPVLGAIEGYMTGWMFDGIGERSAKIGENIANKIFPKVTTQNQAINKALTQQGGSMLSNAVFFGGYGNAEEYLRTGKISPETFATNAGMGIALGIREPAKLLFAKGINAFIATPKEVINRLANDPIQTEDYTKKAEEKISAIENGTTTDREGDLALAKINANLANLNAIVDEIRDNKDEVTKVIKDSDLEPKAKEIIIDKINEVDADNDPKVQATKDINDKIAKIDEQLETIKSNKSWDDARKEVESAPLKEQKQALKDEAIATLNKPIETEFKLGDKSFKTEKELTDWLDKNYNEEDRFTSVNEDGYLEPNTMKVFNKWYKENKPRLAQEHMDKLEQSRPPKDVTFIGKQEGEIPEENLDLYNVKVGDQEATFAVPSGSGRDVIEAKKQATIDKFKPAESKESIPLVEEKTDGSTGDTQRKVKSVVSDTHTKGIFEDEKGNYLKSTTSQNRTMEGGKVVTTDGKRTDEYELLKENQDISTLPRVGNLVQTEKGEMFEIEKLSPIEKGKLTYDEYRKAEEALHELNNRGIRYSDNATVMRRANGEVVLIDLSNAWKTKDTEIESLGYKVDDLLNGEDRSRLDAENNSENKKKLVELLSKKNPDKNQYLLTQRPPSIGTHPEGTIGDPIEVPYKNGRKAWLIEYESPLSDKQITNFELTRVPNVSEIGDLYKRKFGKGNIYLVIENVSEEGVKINEYVDGVKETKELSYRDFAREIEKGGFKKEDSTPKSSLEESKPILEENNNSSGDSKPSLTDNKVEEVLSKGDEIKAKQEAVKPDIIYVVDKHPELKFLEEDLPSKKPDKKDMIDISDFGGEIRVKPIPQKIKVRSENDALKSVVSKDQERPAMTGVFYDAENQVKVGTDAHVLVVIPSKITGVSRIIDTKTGEEIKGVMFPKYESVIPKNETITEVDITDLLSQVSGIDRANAFVDTGWRSEKGVASRVVINGEEFFFNPSILKRGLLPLLETGTTKVVMESSNPNRAVIFRDVKNKKKFSLVMPMMLSNGVDNSVVQTILDTNRPKGVTKSEELNTKVEVVKGKIADNLDNLMSAIGGIKNITGDQRVKVLSELADLAKNIAELTSLKGEQLWNEVKKYLDERKITLPDDLISESKTSIIDTYSEKTTEKGSEVSAEEKTIERSSGDKKNERKQTAFETNSVSGRSDRDVVGKTVDDIVKTNPHFYDVVHKEEIVNEAKNYIQERGIESAYADLIGKTQDINELPTRHVARQILMQHFGNELAEMNKMNDKAGANISAEKIINLEAKTQEEGRIGARTVAFTMWKLLNPQASVFMVDKLVNDLNKKRLGFDEQGARDFMDTWKNEVPDMVKKLVTENKEFKDVVDKLTARVKQLEDKIGKQTPRVTKEKAKEMADKVRSLKSSSWGLTFADPVGVTAIWDGALEVIARGIEATGNVMQAINDGLAHIQNSQWYKGLKSSQKEEVDKKFREKMRENLEYDAEEYIKNTSWFKADTKEKVEPTDEQKANKDQKKAQKDADERLREHIYDIITDHLLVDKEKEEDLADRLKRELGLTDSEAKKVAESALKSFKQGAQNIFDKTLKPKIKNEVKEKKAFDKFFNLIKKGVLNDANYAQPFAEKYGLRKGLTTEEKTELTRLGMNAQKLAPYGSFGELALHEFLQYTAKLTDSDNKATTGLKLMNSLNYARMLSGPTTSFVNISSAYTNVGLRPILTATNMGRWADWLTAKAKGEKEKAQIINPLMELYYIPEAYKIGASIGFNQAMNIVKHGDITGASKYMESIGNGKGINMPELEKNKFGVGKRFMPVRIFGKDFNPFNASKYSGRFLTAQDIQGTNIPFALELALATRRNAIKEGSTLSEKELKDKILGEIQGTFLTEEQSKQIDEQINSQIQSLRDAGIDPDERQIKQRRFELTRTLLDLNPDVEHDALQMAKQDIFNGQRGGVFSTIGDWMGRNFNKNVVIKTATMGEIPFTTVLGHIADFSLDANPVWGAIRARGWSPTGLIARGRQWADTGSWKDALTSPKEYGKFSSAQMGKVGSPEYYQQMNRAWFGLTAMALAGAIFLKKDPDDGSEPRWDITGGLVYSDPEKKQGNNMGVWTMRIPLPFKGHVDIRYNNLPIMNFALGTIGSYKDAQRAGAEGDDLLAKLHLAGTASMRAMTQVKDTWLARGIANIADLIGNVAKLGTIKGRQVVKDPNAPDVVHAKQVVSAGVKTIVNDYASMPFKAIDPLKSNLVQQIWKGITPEGRLTATPMQILKYNLGIQNGIPFTKDKTGKPIGSNELRTDIFGQVVKTMPGDQGIAWPRKDDKYWDKMWKYNINVEDVTPKDRVVNKGIYSTLEYDQYLNRKAEINELFRKRFDEYFNGLTPDELKEKAKIVNIDDKTGIKTTQINDDVNLIWLNTKDDVNKKMFVWDKEYKKSPKDIELMQVKGALPRFWNEKMKIDGKEQIMPYPELEKINKTAMEYYMDEMIPILKDMTDKDIKDSKKVDIETGLVPWDELLKTKWGSAVKGAKAVYIEALDKK